MLWYNRYILKDMTTHKCNHEADFGRINTEINDLKGIIKGEGGLQTTVIELNVTVQNLTETVKGLKTVISAFSKFQTESEANVRAEERIKADKRVKDTNRQWAWGTVIGALGLISGIIIAILK
jgi:3-deoxy-D-arabino-heptulosonate 7-phosphate (DAHP) synthase class II